jgi:hypothetical protein
MISTVFVSFSTEGLRAADAGHLFVMEHCAAGLENLVLVTFDSEMTKAAERRGLAFFTH